MDEHLLIDFTFQRSIIYGFLATVYNQRPGVQLINSFTKLQSVKLCESDNKDLVHGLFLLQEFAQSLTTRSKQEVQLEIGSDWTKLFRGVRPGYGPPPPFEGGYQTVAQKELTELYASIGLELPAGFFTQPDYIGVQLEFMQELVLREHAKWQKGLEDNALDLVTLERSFLIEHLYSWVPQFCQIALAQADTDFGKGVILFTKGYLISEKDWLESFCKRKGEL